MERHLFKHLTKPLKYWIEMWNNFNVHISAHFSNSFSWFCGVQSFSLPVSKKHFQILENSLDGSTVHFTWHPLLILHVSSKHTLFKKSETGSPWSVFYISEPHQCICNMVLGWPSFQSQTAWSHSAHMDLNAHETFFFSYYLLTFHTRFVFWPFGAFFIELSTSHALTSSW